MVGSGSPKLLATLAILGRSPLAAELEPEPPLFVGNAIVNALNLIGTPEAEAAVAAWEERGETPPDALHGLKVEEFPMAVITPLRHWWYRPWWWPGWLKGQWKKKRH
jgi:hypothetical protein